MDEKPGTNWLVRSSRAWCTAVLVLLVAAYFASYRVLLVDEAENLRLVSSTTEELLIIPPFPVPVYGEKYKIEGEVVRWFFWPANRMHRVIHRMSPG